MTLAFSSKYLDGILKETYSSKVGMQVRKKNTPICLNDHDHDEPCDMRSQLSLPVRHQICEDDGHDRPEIV
jgi:hypothetical protein